MKFIYSILLLSILSACTKEPLPTPPPVNPPYKSKLEVLWNTPISADTAAYTSIAQSLVKDGVVFNTNFYVPTGFVRVLEAETGQTRWRFDNFLSPNAAFSRNTIPSINNKVIINRWDETYCVDAESGNLDRSEGTRLNSSHLDLSRMPSSA